MLSLGTINKLGYFTAFAICAIGLDLVWGYMGVLSLCQFLFFALGGYCMGLYLINHGPMDGPNGDIPRALFVVMSGVSDAQPPWFLAFFQTLPGSVLLGGVAAGAARFAHRHHHLPQPRPRGLLCDSDPGHHRRRLARFFRRTT